MFDWLWDLIWGAVGGALRDVVLKLIWMVFVQGPLHLIAAFNKVLEYLTGGIITDLLFGSQKDFHWNQIPVQFWWFIAVAICLFALIFTIQMIILIFQEAAETKTKFVVAIQMAVKAFCFMFLIPIFFFIANFIVQNLAKTVINSFGNGYNISDFLWHIGDPDWNGSVGGVDPSYGPPDNLDNYNFIAQIFGTWFMLYAIFMIGIILIQKVIELFFLFMISPLVMIIMVIDNGKAAFTWKDMVIAKFLASTGTLIGYYIFMSAIQILISSTLNSLNGSAIEKQLFLILFLCGGGFAAMAFSDLIASFLGEAVGLREAKSSFKTTFRAGMATIGVLAAGGGALKMAGKLAGKAGKSIIGKNKDDGNESDQKMEPKKEKLDLNPMRNATKKMSKRTGIVGLAGNVLDKTGNAFGHTAAKAMKVLNMNKVKPKNKNNQNQRTNNTMDANAPREEER